MNIKSEFSSDNLIKLLQTIITEMKSNKISLETQEEIWNALMWDKDEPVSKEMIKCLFTGWWVRENLTDGSNTH